MLPEKLDSLSHFNPLSLYRERPLLVFIIICRYVISIHSPYTGRDNARAITLDNRGYISIHSPYTGRDKTFGSAMAKVKAFQSTLPIQGETVSGTLEAGIKVISIHSPYTGRDEGRKGFGRYDIISIHSPYTGRDASWILQRRRDSISIHSPYTGRDVSFRL